MANRFGLKVTVWKSPSMLFTVAPSLVSVAASLGRLGRTTSPWAWMRVAPMRSSTGTGRKPSTIAATSVPMMPDCPCRVTLLPGELLVP